MNTYNEPSAQGNRRQLNCRRFSDAPFILQCRLPLAHVSGIASRVFLCRSSLSLDPKEEAGLRETVERLDSQQDLREFSASAASALSTSKELAERQQQALEAGSQDLLCSPDIIRQGLSGREHVNDPSRPLKQSTCACQSLDTPRAYPCPFRFKMPPTCWHSPSWAS